MNKLFLKVIMPLLFLQVMCVVSTSAQSLSAAPAGGSVRTVSAANTTITYPVNPVQSVLAIDRFTVLQEQYSQQLAAAQSDPALAYILDAKASTCKAIILNLMDGMSVAAAVAGPYSLYVTKVLKSTDAQSVAQFQEFKGSIQSAIQPKN